MKQKIRKKKGEAVILTILVQYICLIEQAQGQDGWILAKFSFCAFMDQDEVEVHKNEKKNEANIQLS